MKLSQMNHKTRVSIFWCFFQGWSLWSKRITHGRLWKRLAKHESVQ